MPQIDELGALLDRYGSPVAASFTSLSSKRGLTLSASGYTDTLPEMMSRLSAVLALVGVDGAGTSTSTSSSGSNGSGSSSNGGNGGRSIAPSGSDNGIGVASVSAEARAAATRLASAGLSSRLLLRGSELVWDGICEPSSPCSDAFPSALESIVTAVADSLSPQLVRETSALASELEGSQDTQSKREILRFLAPHHPLLQQARWTVSPAASDAARRDEEDWKKAIGNPFSSPPTAGDFARFARGIARAGAFAEVYVHGAATPAEARAFGEMISRAVQVAGGAGPAGFLLSEHAELGLDESVETAQPFRPSNATTDATTGATTAAAAAGPGPSPGSGAGVPREANGRENDGANHTGGGSGGHSRGPALPATATDTVTPPTTPAAPPATSETSAAADDAAAAAAAASAAAARARLDASVTTLSGTSMMLRGSHLMQCREFPRPQRLMRPVQRVPLPAPDPADPVAVAEAAAAAGTEQGVRLRYRVPSYSADDPNSALLVSLQTAAPVRGRDGDALARALVPLPPSSSSHLSLPSLTRPTRRELAASAVGMHVLSDALAELAQEACFHELRTEKRLGYVVICGTSEAGGPKTFNVIIQVRTLIITRTLYDSSSLTSQLPSNSISNTA